MIKNKEKNKKEQNPPLKVDPTIDWEDKYKRALADYQNLLKRTAAEKDEWIKYSHRDIVLQILPVYDNLRIALDHAGETEKKNDWLTGVGYVLKQFKGVLEELGVSEIEAEGLVFDPNTMEAMAGEGEQVDKIIKPGYRLNKKVLVPVKVSLKK